MTDKVIAQVVSTLRGSALPEGKQFELAVQALTWAHLSTIGAIPEDLRLTSEVAANPHRAATLMAGLGAIGGLVGQAFAGSDVPDNARHLAAALETSLRLSTMGLVANLQIADVFASLQPKTGLLGLPAELAELMVGLAQVEAGQEVYVPWDTTAQLAVRAAVSDAQVYFEDPLHSAIPPLVSLLSKRPFEVHFGNPILDPSAVENGKLKKFAVTIAAPPFGQRFDHKALDHDVFHRFRYPSLSPAVLALQHVLSQTSGRAIVLVPNSFLFSGSAAEVEFRRELVTQGLLRAVIQLPAIFPASNVAASLLVIDATAANPEVRFLNADAERFRTQTTKSRSRLCEIENLIEEARGSSAVPSPIRREVGTAEIEGNDWNLQPQRYLLGSAAQQIQDRLTKGDTTPLGNLVEVLRPLPVLRDGGGMRAFEVGAADLPPFGFIRTASRAVTIDPQVSERNVHQFLQPCDIVIVVKGSTGKIGIVPPDAPPPGEGGWIAGQSAVVLRTKAGAPIDAVPLAMQLRSPVGQELLKVITSGASIPLIQIRELLQLQLFVPDAATADIAKTALEEEAALQAQIDELRARQTKAAAELWQLV